MFRRKFSVVLLISIAIFSFQSVNADILSLYTFSDNDLEDSQGNEIAQSMDTHAETYSGMYSTRSSLIGPTQSGVASTNHGFVSALNTPDNIEPSVNGYFHEFTTLIQNGSWNIDAITFDYWVNNPEDDSRFTVAVFSDRTGTDFASQSLGSFTYDMAAGDTAEKQTITINFPDVAPLEGLTAGESTSFRLMFSDNQNVGFVHRIDDIEIRGNLTAVPEPGTIAVLGLVSLGFLRRRRN